MPKKVEYARPFFTDRTRWGSDKRTKDARTDGQIIENLRCHCGSTRYELREKLNYLYWKWNKEHWDPLVLLEFWRNNGRGSSICHVGCCERYTASKKPKAVDEECSMTRFTQTNFALALWPVTVRISHGTTSIRQVRKTFCLRTAKQQANSWVQLALEIHNCTMVARSICKEIIWGSESNSNA